MTLAVLHSLGTLPSFIDFLQILANGGAREFLHVLRSIAGNPSGPAAEFIDNSSIAEDRSVSEKYISPMVDPVLLSFGNSSFGISSEYLGLLNTEQY